MCGSYTLTDPSPLMRRFGLIEFAETRITPRFNIAPSQIIPIIVERPEGRELRMARWGFKPPWMKGPQKRPPPIDEAVPAQCDTARWRPSPTRGPGAHHAGR